MTLLSSKNKFSFIHIPKNGGSSITQALAPYLDNPKDISEYCHGWQRKHHLGLMHATYLESRHLIPEDFKVFAVWRNPLDRFVSIWRYAAKGLSVLDFALKLKKRGFCQRLEWPQKKFVEGKNNVIFISFDRLEEGFHSMCMEVNLPKLKLNRLNPTNRDSDFESFYNEEIKRVVSEIYKSDLEQNDTLIDIFHRS